MPETTASVKDEPNLGKMVAALKLARFTIQMNAGAPEPDWIPDKAALSDMDARASAALTAIDETLLPFANAQSKQG